MPNRDQFEMFDYFHALDTAALAATTNGYDVDMQGYDSLTFVIALGRCSHVSTLSYWQLRLQHANASVSGGAGTYADCVASEMIRQASGVVASGVFQQVITDVAASNSVQGSTQHFVGYIGVKRYVRLVPELVGLASILNIGVTALKGLPSVWPVNTANRDLSD